MAHIALNPEFPQGTFSEDRVARLRPLNDSHTLASSTRAVFIICSLTSLYAVMYTLDCVQPQEVTGFGRQAVSILVMLVIPAEPGQVEQERVLLYLGSTFWVKSSRFLRHLDREDRVSEAGDTLRIGQDAF